MAFDAQVGEQYTIRRKVFTFLGAKFHIYDPNGNVIAFCKQKAFTLREDIRLFTDETCTKELFVIKARNIIDFSASYVVTAGEDGPTLGTFRRDGMKSVFVRDAWQLADASGAMIAALEEEPGMWTVLRRWVDLVSLFSPQTFTLARPGKEPLATFRVHKNPFVYRLSIAVLANDATIDDLLILAAGCLIAAIEGRQNSN